MIILKLKGLKELRHRRLVLVYYYFFGVFLPTKTIILRFPLMRKQFCQIRKK